jgi:hypothetical protein
MLLLLLPPPAACPQQREFGACDEDWMKEGNYCLYTCGRAKNCGGEGESQGSDNNNSGESESESSDSGSSVKPSNPNVCDDIQPPGEYTCQQQVSCRGLCFMRGTGGRVSWSQGNRKRTAWSFWRACWVPIHNVDSGCAR